MVFGFGKKKQVVVAEEPEYEPVRFQGSLNGKNADLASNGKLVQVGLSPLKEIVSASLERGAQALRLEPKGDSYIAYQMIDGIAYSATRYPKQVGNAVVQMFKLLSGLNIKVRNKPQSGGLKAEFDDQPYKLLAESSPMVGGAERLIIRSQNLNKAFESPEDIGITGDLKEKIKNLTAQHRGVLVVCGPPASGTTTTLFGILRSIDGYTHSIYNISSIDIEEIHNITDYDVNPEDDLATTLKRLERIEADIVLIDPITDSKTAQAVFSNCGNLTILTEHRAKDVFSSIRQLSQWISEDGGNPNLLAEGLSGVISQKLIRLLCKGCKEAYRPNPKMLSKIGLPADTEVLFRPFQKEVIAAKLEQGEKVPCAETGGYWGRTGMFELIEMSPEMRKLLASGVKTEKIKSLSRKQKMHTYMKDGLNLIAKGKTSLEELQRLLKAS